MEITLTIKTKFDIGTTIYHKEPIVKKTIVTCDICVDGYITSDITNSRHWCPACDASGCISVSTKQQEIRYRKFFVSKILVGGYKIMTDQNGEIISIPKPVEYIITDCDYKENQLCIFEDSIDSSSGSFISKLPTTENQNG